MRRPACRVIGVQSDAAPIDDPSFAAGRPIDTDAATPTPTGSRRGSRPGARDADVRPGGRDADRHRGGPARAHRRLLTDALGITVEGAAAADLGGLLVGPPPDGPVLLVITGSNT